MEMTESGSENLERFFLHYPQGHHLYVCIVDQKRFAFDFTNNTFRPGNKLASMRDACLYADGRHEERADHGYSYAVEIDLSRLLMGTCPETIPADGALVTVHWLQQVGDHPDVTVDKRLPHSCSLRNVGGRFQPANKWDADQLDEARAFEKRAAQETEYRDFTLREIDSRDVTHRQLVTGVREGKVADVLRVLAKDICEWAGSLKQHLLHQVMHLAKDPFFVRSRTMPENAPFQVFEHWAVRPWIGSHEAYNLLEFHKSAEFARSFSQRLEELHQARVEFSRQVIEYTVQHCGEDVEGVFVLDEARKDLKHMALSLAEYLDIIAQQFEAASGAASTPPGPHLSMATAPERSGQTATQPDERPLLRRFADALSAYSTVLNRTILEALHPEIESFEDAINWTTNRQAELDAARQSVDQLAGRQLVIAVIPPEGARSDEWTVQLLSLVAESFHAVSYVFTSGPPQATSDDPRAKMAASVVSRQVETASKLLREIDARRRHIEATCLALRPDESCPGEAKLDARPFNGGEMLFFSDRVELCGVDICSGQRSGSRRIILELLSRRRKDGSFLPYSGDDLETAAKQHGARGTAGGWIRDLRDDIMERLRNRAGIVCGQKDVILSGESGYRFVDRLTVQFADAPVIRDITDITDTDDDGHVPNDDVRDVFDVRDDAAGARLAWILQELTKGRRLKAPDVAEHFGCSVKTAQRDLTALKDDGKVEFVGAPRTGFYRVRQAPEAS